MPDRFAVTGGGGLWNTTDSWSASSGGASGASIPGVSDKAILDSNSPEITIDTTISIGDIDIQANQLNADGYDITVSGTFNVRAGAVLSLKGTETISTPTFEAGAGCTYKGDNVASTKTIKNWSYTGLTFNDLNTNKSTFQFAENHTELGSLIISDCTVDFNGKDISITGSFTIGSMSSVGTLKMTGGETVSKGPTSNYGTVEYTGTSGPYTVNDWTYKHLTINGSGGAFNLGAALSPSGDLTVTAGNFFASGYDVTVAGTFSVASGAILTLMGTETITAPTLDAASWVYYVGDDVADTKTIKNWTYGKVLIYDYNTNKSTFQFGEAHTEIKQLNVTLGTLDLNDFSHTTTTLTVNGGTLLGGTGTLSVAGNCTMSSGTFTAETSTLKITAASTVTLSAGNPYKFVVDDTGLTITMATALTTTNTTTITDGILSLNGNNLTSGSTFTIAAAGTLKLLGTETVTTPTIATGGTVEYAATSGTVTLKNWTYKNLKINGAGGTFKFGETHTGITTFTVTAGTFSQAAGDYAIGATTMVVNGGTFTGGATTLTVTTFTVSSGVFNAGSGTDALTTLNVTGGTFNGDTSTINVTTFSMTNGVFVSTTGSLTLPTNSGSFTLSGGTFNQTAGTVVLGNASTGTMTLNITTGSFWNVTFNGSSSNTINITGTIDVNGTTRFSECYIMSGGTIAASGNVVSTSSNLYVASTVLKFDGVNQTFNASGGTGRVPRIEIASSGTLTISDTMLVANADSTVAWKYTSGAVSDTSGTVQIGIPGNRTCTIDSGAQTFPNVVFAIGSAGNLTITGTMDINGNLTIGATLGYLYGGTIRVAGNFTCTAYATLGSTCAFIFDGGNSQTINSSAGRFTSALVTIDKTVGTTATLTGALSLNSTGQDFTITSGTLDLAGFGLTVNDAFNVAANGTIRLKGTESVSKAPTLASGSTVVYYGDNTGTSLTMKNWAYKNLTINDENVNKDRFVFSGNQAGIVNLIGTSGALDLAGYSIIVSGTFSIAVACPLWVKGNEVSVSSPTFAVGASCIYYGDNTGGTKAIKNWVYENITINDVNVSPDIFQFGENHSEIKTLNMVGGTLNLNDTTIDVVTVTSSGGSIDFTDGVFNVSGDVDLSGCVAITANLADFTANGIASQSIDLNNSIWDVITVTNPSPSSITFPDGFETNELILTTPGSHIIFGSTKTFKVNTLLQIFGTSISHVTIESTSAGSAWILNAVCSTRECGYVNVKDSNNNSGTDITCSFGTNNGGNTGWVFVEKYIWDGSGSDNLASTKENWIGDEAPVVSNTVLFNGMGTKDCTWDLTGHYSMMEIATGYTGTITLVQDLYLDTNFDQQDGTIIHTGGCTSIIIEGNFTIGAGGTFTASTSVEVWQDISLDEAATIDLTAATVILNGWTVQAISLGGFAVDTLTIPNVLGVVSLLEGFDAVTFTPTLGAYIRFGAGETFTIGTFSYAGVSGTVNLRSSSTGSYWYLVLTGSCTLADKADVKDSDASGGLLVNAYESEDSGHNINWNFLSANARFCVGSGWNNVSNWAASSGGAPGASIPGPANIAVFDSNSPACGIDVAVDVLGIYITSGYAFTLTQNNYAMVIGEAGWEQSGGTFNAHAAGMIFTGPLSFIGGTFNSIYEAIVAPWILTFDEAARNTDPNDSNVKKDVNYKIHNVEKTGTLESTDPGVANVIKDVNYIIESVAKVGTFDEATRNTDPGVANVEDGVDYKIHNIEKTGTLVTTDPGEANVKKDVDYTIKSVAKTGTLESTDPGVANVKKDVDYVIESVAKTGTLESTDPGEDNVVKDVNYIIESVAKTGTFDEAARNTDPGEANVDNGVDYKIHNVEKTGNLVSTDPGVGNVIKDVNYTIKSVAKTGTFDEATRNTNPGESNVSTLAGTYKHLNVVKTPTLDLAAENLAFEASRNTSADPAKYEKDATFDQFGATVTGLFDEAARNISAGAENILEGASETIQGVVIEGTAIEEHHTSDQVLKSAGGIWDDDNILSQEDATENFRKDLSIGLDWTGGLVGQSPADPTLLAEDKEDGTGAIFYLEGEDPDTINTLYVAGIGLDFESKGSVWDDGEMDVELTAGLYWAFVISENEDGGKGISNMVRIVTTIGDDAADDNISLAVKAMKKKAVYWSVLSPADAHGQPTYNPPTEISCRWDDVEEEFIDSEGTRRLSSAKLIVDRDLEISGLIRLGAIDTLTDPDNPKGNEDVWEILKFSKIANLKGKKYIREVFL